MNRMISAIVPFMTLRPFSPPALLAAFLLSVLPSAAQEGATVALQFLSFPRSLAPEPVELVVGEGKTIVVEIPTNELSRTYKVKRQGTWAVGETIEGKDGNPACKTFGQARALASPRQLILLIRKGRENADGFELIPIDSRGTKFGGGKFLFLNATKINIAGVVGAEKFAVRPGKYAIIKPKIKAGEHTCHTALYYQKDGKQKNFFSSKWPVSKTARGLIFFYHDPDTRRIRLHSIRDFL